MGTLAGSRKMKSLLIRNASLLSDPKSRSTDFADRPIDLLLQDGKIVEIGTSIHPNQDTEILDASGLIVTPGWIDIQLNGAFGADFTENPDLIWKAAMELPKLGTTSFLPTIITSPLEKVEHAIKVMQNGPPSGYKGANALGLHLEGSFLNAEKKGAHNPRYIQSPDLKIIRQWTRANGIYLVTLAPELDNGLTVTKRLQEEDVVVSIGHSMATYEQASEAFMAGIRCGTHLFNAQSEIEHRKPGLSIALLNTPNIYTGVIVDGIHIHPGMVKLAWTCKGSHRFITVTDAISALGMPPGTYNLGEFKIFVTETTVTLDDGTLAGSNITQQKSLINLMRWTGCSLIEAVNTVTDTPAGLLNLPNKGKISINADADLVLITSEIDIKATIVGGEILFKDF
jgi:N-acetylglucosamine-6-phosphate deacetylase